MGSRKLSFGTVCALLALALLQGCGSSGSSSTTPPPPPPPTVGASVNEQQETAILYVDPSGSDSNDGSKNAPFQTINKALATAAANNQNSVGTQINVNPGTYREQLNIPASTTSLPFTLQAATTGTVTISGADQIGSWIPAPTYGAHVYTSAATSNYVYAACTTPAGWPPVPPILLRREMVFVNGARMNQVLFSNQLQPGTFWAQPVGQIYLWPPAGTDLATADVEVSTASRSPLLETKGTNNFVIRGLTFEYDDSCIQSGSRIANATNVLLDSDQFLWSNSQGFGVFAGSGTTSNVTVQNSFANHNGQIGFTGKQVKYALYQNNESSYNGWRGALAGYYAYAFDGSDFFLHHNSDFNNLTAFYNLTSGIHFDTDNANDQVTGLQSGGNNLEGLLIEASQGPFTVQNSALCSNALAPKSDTGNLEISDSSNLTLTGNTIYNGGPEQEYIEGGGRAGTDWEQPSAALLRFNQNLTQKNNSFIGTAGQVGFYSYYKHAPSCSAAISDMWQTFGGTLSSESNTWGDTAASNASFPFFEAAVLNGTVPLSTWQASPPTGAGQDTSSTFSANATPPSQCALPTPDSPDFWLVVGTRDGAAAIIPQAGAADAQVPIVLTSIGFTGAISLSLDTTQSEGVKVAGVTGSFSPQSFPLSPSNPPVPVASTLTISTTSSTPEGFYPLTITATNGQGITRTGVVFLQVGTPTALQLVGNDTIKSGSCAIFQIHSVDSQGGTSEVADNTYLNISGTGSGQFYEDSSCTTPVRLTPIETGCPAGVAIPKGEYAPHFSGTESIWFMDSKAESLNVTITDQAGVLKPATATITVQ